MASKDYWKVDPLDERAMWLKINAHSEENIEDASAAAAMLFWGVGDSCLEIGAGVGRLMKYAEAHYRRVWGVDYSETIVAMARKHLVLHPRCSVVLTDGLHLPFADSCFDLVYSYACFQHIPELYVIQKNLREALRVLRPGGTCRVQTVQGDPTSGLYDGVVFPTPTAFTKEFEVAGFTKVRAESVNSWIWVKATKGEPCASV